MSAPGEAADGHIAAAAPVVGQRVRINLTVRSTYHFAKKKKLLLSQQKLRRRLDNHPDMKSVNLPSIS